MKKTQVIPKPVIVKIELTLFQAHLLYQLIRPFLRCKTWISSHRYFYSQLRSCVEDLTCAEFEYEKSIEHLPF